MSFLFRFPIFSCLFDSDYVLKTKEETNETFQAVYVHCDPLWGLPVGTPYLLIPFEIYSNKFENEWKKEKKSRTRKSIKSSQMSN